jgi:chromosome segregation ATPase
MKSPSNPKPLRSLADYVKISSELEELDASITKRKANVVALGHQIAVLDTSILYKNKLLDEIAEETRWTEVQAQNRLNVIEKKIADREVEYVDLGAALEQVDIEAPKRTLKRLKEQVEITQAEIDERKRYLQEQEDLIAAAMEEGNLKLKSVGYEVQGLEDMKTALIEDLAELNKEKQKLVDDLVALEENRRDSNNEELLHVQQINSEVDKANARLADLQRLHKRVSEETDKKLIILQAKEESLLAKQAAMRKESAELATTRRRLEGVRSLYET